MLFLDSSASDFNEQLQHKLNQTHQTSNDDVTQTVQSIIADVQSRGDEALYDYTQRFDGVDYRTQPMQVSRQAIDDAITACSTETLAALKLAAQRIESYHRKQLPDDMLYQDEIGVTLGWKWNAIDAVGLYVPGGTASYPSSVLMNAIPASIAGVSRMAMVVPAPKGELNPLVLAAADIAGVSEVYTIGGAQAVAALAYGTETILPVDKIVGPGNAYVAEAKRQVFGKVGIDMIAGPSDILVIADSNNNPDWIAADLLSQAEHDVMAQSVLITNDDAFGHDVVKSLEAMLPTLPRESIARSSWERNSLVIVANSLIEAANIANIIAPEHMELAVEDPHALMQHIKHAGAIFLGRYTPEAIGDYLAGPSHVLPTNGSARFSSGLGVYDFLKRSSILGCSKEACLELQQATALLAKAEGLDAHRLSAEIRT